MASAGAPLRSLQAWMGHVDASTTEIYTHYAPDLAGERSLADKAFSVAPAPGACRARSATHRAANAGGAV